MNRITFDQNSDAASADARRRHFVMQAGAGASALTAGLLLSAKASEGAGAEAPAGNAQSNAIRSQDASPGAFWPNGIRLVVSISMMRAYPVNTDTH
jgi:hypothetical protein